MGRITVTLSGIERTLLDRLAQPNAELLAPDGEPEPNGDTP